MECWEHIICIGKIQGINTFLRMCTSHCIRSVITRHELRYMLRPMQMEVVLLVECGKENIVPDLEHRPSAAVSVSELGL